ncbi:hypothetical protein AB0E71_37210, partial [Streptomyces narbonensis]|uniref:hypothetical protein n=1 Tax=Streptomyces narbonensis TaxID=67333 RepID=UPI0033C2BA98
VQEIRARGARTIVIAEEGDEAVVPYADHLIIAPPVSPLTFFPLRVAGPTVAVVKGDRGCARADRTAHGRWPPVRHR